MANWPILVVVFGAFYVLGYETKSVHFEDDLTVLIDSKEYFELINTHHKQNVSKVCSASENEVYEKCGKKCIAACRFASSTLKLTATKDECKKTDCIEGCFCKDGFVRYGNKCVPAAKCPVSSRATRTDKSIDVASTEPPQSLFKHFGFFMRPNGCGPGGCGGSWGGCGPSGCGGGCGPSGCGGGPPISCGPNGCGIHIHNHNEALNGDNGGYGGGGNVGGGNNGSGGSGGSGGSSGGGSGNGSGSGGSTNNNNNNNNNPSGTTIIIPPGWGYGSGSNGGSNGGGNNGGQNGGNNGGWNGGGWTGGWNGYSPGSGYPSYVYPWYGMPGYGGYPFNPYYNPNTGVPNTGTGNFPIGTTVTYNNGQYMFTYPDGSTGTYRPPIGSTVLPNGVTATFLPNNEVRYSDGSSGTFNPMTGTITYQGVPVSIRPSRFGTGGFRTGIPGTGVGTGGRLSDNSPEKQNTEHMETQNVSPTSLNKYSQYPYPFANQNIPIATLVGAAISPAIIGYYSIPNTSGSSSNKSSKKKSSNRQSANNSKNSPQEAVRQETLHGAMQTATPHPQKQSTEKPNMQFDLNGNPIMKGTPSKTVFSPNQIPSKDQVAYFNYLNTYTPSQFELNQQYFNGGNSFAPPFIPPNAQPNYFNLNNQTPFSGQNVMTNQNSPSFNMPLDTGNKQDASANPYSAFNRYNPVLSFNGNISPQFFMNPSDQSFSGNSFTINESSDESDEEIPTMRKPRL